MADDKKNGSESTGPKKGSKLAKQGGEERGLIQRVERLENHAKATSAWLERYTKANSDWLEHLYEWVISVDNALDKRFALADPPPKPPTWDKPPRPGQDGR